MRGVLTILILTIAYSITCAQANKVTTTFYANGQINTIDSVYDCDSIRLHKNYYADILSMDSGIIYLGNTGWDQIESEGEYLLIGENSWTQHGKWTYWSEKGKIILETITPNDGRGTIYLNQWLPNGTQSIKNGYGYYYQKGMERHTEYGSDSSLYEIKDSLKNGTYCVWCPLKDGTFYKCETGQYINNIRQPIQISFHENGQIREIATYNRGKREGECHIFFSNGSYSEYGSFSDGNKIGFWKYWNEEGNLVKECNYQKGNLKGYYAEYYPSGQLRFSGNYIHMNGKGILIKEDFVTGELIKETIDIDDQPAKDGAWNYYNENGQLIKTDIYLKGELKKE